MGKKAVVLGGGGAKGAYEIGVMDALIELGFDYQIVTGTSVGSLNGALFAQKDLKLAKKMWMEIDTAHVLDIGEISNDKISYKELGKLLFENRGLSYQNLQSLLTKVISEEKIRQNQIDFGLVTVRYPSLRPVSLWTDEIEKGRLIDYLLASAACFPALKPHNINGEKFIDGGYYDNVPIDLAISRGANEIVAVDLEAIGVVRKEKNRPDVKITLIRSEWGLGPMLLFDKEQAAINLRQGYIDTLKAFSKCEGKRFAFRLGETEKIIKRVYPYLEKLKEELFSDTKNPLVHMVQISVESLYKKRFHSKKKLKREELYLAMTEGLMEILDFDRFCQYSFRKLSSKAVRNLKEISEQPAQQIEEKLAEIKITKKFIENIDALTEIVRQIDRKAVLKYLVSEIQVLRQSGDDKGIFYLLFICIPLEMTSAMLCLSFADSVQQTSASKLIKQMNPLKNK